MSTNRHDCALLNYGLTQMIAARDRTTPESGNLYDRFEAQRGIGILTCRIVFWGGAIPHLMADPPMRHNFIQDTPDNFRTLATLTSALTQTYWLALPTRRSIKTLSDMMLHEPSHYIRLQLAIWIHTRYFEKPSHAFQLDQAEDAACELANMWNALTHKTTRQAGE